MDEKFFTTEQIANILQVHPFTILKFIKQGKLKGIKLGRVYRIKESDINKFLEDRMTPGATPPKEEKTPKAKNEKIDTFQPENSDEDEKDEDNHYYII